MVQQAGLRTPPRDGHAERLQRQMPIVDGADGPAHHEAREQIEHRRQIELPALADDELGRVADPPPIGRVRGELSVEEIRRHRLIVVAHRGALNR